MTALGSRARLISRSVPCAVQEPEAPLTEDGAGERGVGIGPGPTHLQSHRVLQSARGQDQAQ